MTTDRQDKEFITDMISKTLLEDAIDWIKRHLNPEDVFDPRDLAVWSEENGYIKDNGDD